ncbi:hypothetical protein [Burkholderia sp. MS389]|uniref:hypothetical protein n=1 Tax=Burkholderia sp. MS389 TaxID=2811789 RepID=UPI001EF52E7B|nr:hypothetical protein [Burkholderia sp. MS389]
MPVTAVAPVGPVVPVVLAASVAPPVDDVAAGGFAATPLSTSGDRVVVDKSICIVSVRVSVNEVTGAEIAFQSVYGIHHTKLEYRGRVDCPLMIAIDRERARLAA